MQFEINSASRLPIYQQLVRQVREAIARGDLKPEEQLPSVRQLSRDLVVNPNTIARAYTELERGGPAHQPPGARGVRRRAEGRADQGGAAAAVAREPRPVPHRGRPPGVLGRRSLAARRDPVAAVSVEPGEVGLEMSGKASP